MAGRIQADIAIVTRSSPRRPLSSMFLAVAVGLALTPPANLKAMAETARTV